MRFATDSRYSLILVVAICILVGSFASTDYSGLRGNSYQDSSSSSICVIDLQKVFDSSPRRGELETDLKVAEGEKIKVMEGVNTDIQKLSSELKLYRPGSAEFDRIQHQLGQKQAEFEFLQKKFDRELTEMLLDARNQVLLKIRDEMQVVCQNRGFDIVIQKGYAPKQSPPLEIVLWARPQFDITDEVLTRLTGKQ